MYKSKIRSPLARGGRISPLAVYRAYPRLRRRFPPGAGGLHPFRIWPFRAGAAGASALFAPLCPFRRRSLALLPAKNKKPFAQTMGRKIPRYHPNCRGRPPTAQERCTGRCPSGSSPAAEGVERPTSLPARTKPPTLCKALNRLSSPMGPHAPRIHTGHLQRGPLSPSAARLPYFFNMPILPYSYLLFKLKIYKLICPQNRFALL